MKRSFSVFLVFTLLFLCAGTNSIAANSLAKSASTNAGFITTNIPITADTTITEANLVGSGGYTVSSGKTLTINGPFHAPAQQVFFGAGSVAFGTGAASEVYPEWWGAKGDGITDDTAAIQAAIDSLYNAGVVNTGGVVFFSGGDYAISSPLVLPRTTSTPQHVVHLIGANLRTCHITGLSTFPENRALIEWESLALQTWHQKICNLELRLPDVAGVMAIHYAPTDSSTQAAIIAERLQIELSDILIEGSNTYHSRLIYLQGNVALSDFRNIYGDCRLGASRTYDTVVIETDTTYPHNDGSGINYSTLTNIVAGLRCGGYHQSFKGRFHRTIWDGLIGTGTYSSPNVEITNGESFSLKNFAMEGWGDNPQYKLTSCSTFTLENCGTGWPSDKGGGVGNGMEFYSCLDGVISGHYRYTGTPGFDESSVKNIVIDANCKRLRFYNFQLSGRPGKEITNSAPVANDIYGEFFDVSIFAGGGQLHYTIGTPLQGAPMIKTGVYDFTVHGGAVGSKVFATLPDNATVTRAWYEVLDAPTSAGAATIAFGVSSVAAQGILAATAYDDAAFSVGYHDGIPDGTASTFTTKTTSERNVVFTIGVADLTAGKVQVWIEYMVSD